MKKIFRFQIAVLFMAVIAGIPSVAYAQFGNNGNVWEKINIDIFCMPLINQPGYENYSVSKELASKLQTMKNEETIKKELTKLKFNTINWTEKQEFDDQTEEYYTITTCTYMYNSPTGRLIIEKEGETYLLKFPDEKTKNDFMKSVKAKGYKVIDDYKGTKRYQIPENREAHWMGVTVEEEGNNITIYPNYG